MAFDRSRLLLLGIALAATAFATPTAAQNFFEMLFGGPQRPRQSVPQQANPSADPSQSYFGERPASAPSSGGGGGRVAYCVRLCDGRYFPIQRHANANPVEICNAFCPATQTQVFNGSQIDHAYAANGRAMPLSTTRSSTARRWSRAAPAMAGIRSVSRASMSRPIRPCGRATSWRPATTSRRR